MEGGDLQRSGVVGHHYETIVAELVHKGTIPAKCDAGRKLMMGDVATARNMGGYLDCGEVRV
jgi:hypothetical protein